MRSHLNPPLSHVKQCSRCDNPRAPKSRYCRRCHAAYMRQWRRSRLKQAILGQYVNGKISQEDAINLIRIHGLIHD